MDGTDRFFLAVLLVVFGAIGLGLLLAILLPAL
jgi:hypothetical protein